MKKLFSEGYTSDKQAHENLLNFTSQQGNADYSSSEILLHTYQSKKQGKSPNANENVHILDHSFNDLIGTAILRKSLAAA